MTARAVEKVGLTAIILNERVNSSDTIIENVELPQRQLCCRVDDSKVDVGRKKSPTPTLHDRARQNVILELRYLIGEIGRKQVSAYTKKVSSFRPTTRALSTTRSMIAVPGATWTRT